MKKYFVSIVSSVLVLTTCFQAKEIIETGKGKVFGEKNNEHIYDVAAEKNKDNGAQNHHSATSKRDDSDRTCQQEDKLIHVVYPENAIIFLFNQTTETIGILDYSRNLSALYDGKKGSFFLFHYQISKIFYISEGAWYSDKQPFEKYFENIKSLDHLIPLTQRQGTFFTPETISNDLAEKMSDTLETLDQSYDNECKALAISLEIPKTTGEQFITSLNHFGSVMGKTQVKPRKELKWMFGVYQGLGAFFNYFPTGMAALAKKKIKLNLGEIFNQETGVHLLAYFLKNLNSSFELGTIFSEGLNNEEIFFNLINKLGGDISGGFDGFIKVLSELINFVSGKTSVTNLSELLKEYFKQGDKIGDVKEKLESSIRYLVETVKNSKLEKSFGPLMKFSSQMLEGKWGYKGINLSKVLDLIFKLPSDNVDDTIKLIITMLDTTKTLDNGIL